MNEQKEKVRLELHADAVPVGDGHLQQKGNPFAVVILLANTPQEQPMILGRTESIQNETDPRWIKCFDLEFDFTKNKRINVAVFDKVSKGKEERKGSAVFEIGEILGTPNNVKAKTLGKSGSIFARITRVPDDPEVNLQLGDVKVKDVETNLATTVMGGMDTHPSVPQRVPSTVQAATCPFFLEYLLGGCEIELTIAIDFTCSNGDPRNPGTLLYISSDGVLNDYEKAITAVCGVMRRYNSDQKISVFGFGASYGGCIRHLIQVGSEAELNGLGSVLEAYRHVFQTGINMSGPTVFTKVIDYTADMSRRSQEDAAARDKQSYRVLLILTDGVASDMEQTKLSLIKAMDAPLSVTIVGIGNVNFDKMYILDDVAAGDVGCRDKCHFVKFSEYKDDKSALATATLEKIPDQLVDYFYGKGIFPMPQVSVINNDTNNSFSLEEDLDVSLNANFTSDGVPKLIDHQGCIYHDNEYV